MRQYLQRSLFLWVAFLILAVFAANTVFSWFKIRFDWTEENIYTLSEGTVQIVENLKTPVNIQFYNTKNNEAAPQVLKNHGVRVEDLLKELASLNPEFITLQIINPEPDTDEELQATRSGMQATPLGDSNFILGALFTMGTKEIPLPLFDPSRENYLEYDVSKVLFDLTTEKKNTLGFLSPVAFGPSASNPNGREPYFLTSLKEYFIFSTLDYFNVKEISADIETLLVFHPKEIPAQTEYAIDQFLMRGGKLIVVLDPFFRNDPAQASASQYGQPPPASQSDLPTLLKKWGVQYRPDQAIGDRNLAAIVNTNQGQLPYALWLSLRADNIEKLPYLDNINDVLLVESGAFSIENRPKITYQSLMRSSEQTDFANSTFLNMQDPFTINAQLKSDGGVKELFGLLQGKFPSAFASRPNADSTGYTQPHINQAEQEGKILLLSDGDFLMDGVALDIVNLFGQNLVQYRNDNLKFFYGLIDGLQGGDFLRLIPQRGKTSRSFDRFLAMQRAAQEKFNQTEQRLQAELRNLESELKALKPPPGSAKIALPAATLAKIQQYQEQEVETRKKLRETRRLLREDIDNLKTLLILLNILLVPIVMLGLGVFIYRRRSNRAG